MVRKILLCYFTLFAMAFGVTAPITISPSATSVRGGSTKQFTATLNSATGPVTWSVNGAIGGNDTVGTVTTEGLYTAPLVALVTTIKVRAAASTAFAEAAVTWLNPAPSITSFTPSAVSVGTFTVTLTGKGYVGASQIMMNGTPIPTTFVSSTSLQFTTTVNTAAYLSIQVSNPDPGALLSGTKTLKVMENPTLSVSPTTTTVRLGATKKFYASVSNLVNKTVIWSVNGVPNGTPGTGTIASDGTFTAPSVMPVSPTIISATSASVPTLTAQSTVTLLNPIPVLQTLTPNSLVWGDQTLTVTGTGFVAGSQVRLGDTLFPTQFISPTQVTAAVTLKPTPGGLLAFRVKNPDPGGSTSGILVASAGQANPKVSYLAASRFLEQASWGPDAASIAHVQAVGFETWLNEQMTAPVSLYNASTSTSNSLANQQAEFFTHAMAGQDQLRQRVAFALGQIFVVSGLKTGAPRQMVPYQNMLLNDAFGTYSKILRDVTLSPTMGVYLDMVNNDKANLQNGTAPNENYGREVMQLFSVGTSMLGPDGAPILDGMGNPIPTYDQSVIAGMALALTGWTFPGRYTTRHNSENYNSPMIPVDSNHDIGPKKILGGVTLDGGKTAQQDLDAVLSALTSHQNVAPFISLRLIEHLVTSNPSKAYISRISQVFNATQGDLFQVVKAILLDPEARQGDDLNSVQATGGHLREPVLFVISMMKNLSATVVSQNPVAGLAADQGQSLFYPPSVFNYYSPMYRIAGGLLGPEFQILNTPTSLARVNSVQNLVSRGLDGDAKFNLGPFTQLASSPTDMVNAIDNAFMYGRMPGDLKAAIVSAITVSTSSGERVRSAIYLMASSSLYQVQH